jgi:metal-sulfur cluster biosynthetic enzyme
LTLTPEGCPLADKLTGDEKPLIEVIVAVADAEPPADVLTLWGETPIPKSPGVGWAVTCKEKS